MMISSHPYPVTSVAPESSKGSPMSSKWKWIFGFGIAAIVFIGLFALAYDNFWVPVNISKGTPEPQAVYAAGWISLIVTGLGAFGFSGATLVNLIQAALSYWPVNGINNIPFTDKKTVIAVFDMGKLPLLANAYNATTDPTAKSRMYDALKLEYDAAFERQIPKPLNYVTLESATSVLK